MNSVQHVRDCLLRHKVVHHLFCWLLFITYELSLVYYNIGRLDKAYIYVCYYAINISFFYAYLGLLNATFSVPKPKYLAGLFKLFFLFLIYMGIKLIADAILSEQTLPIDNPFINIKGSFSKNFGRGLYFLVLATFYWSAGHISYFRRQSLAAEKQQLKAEKEKAELETYLERSRNAYLQQQINPHLLFNSLNFVYNKVHIHSDDAANCIWLLSEIMRFSLEEVGPDGKISLEREIGQIGNLIAINQYRFDHPLCLLTNIDEQTYGLRIIPLILLTITENLFKHGNLTNGSDPALLQINVSPEGLLKCKTRNLKKSKNVESERKGLGLENIRVRLNAAYPGNYQLITTENADHFELSLSLHLRP